MGRIKRVGYKLPTACLGHTQTLWRLSQIDKWWLKSGQIRTPWRVSEYWRHCFLFVMHLWLNITHVDANADNFMSQYGTSQLNIWPFRLPQRTRHGKKGSVLQMSLDISLSSPCLQFSGNKTETLLWWKWATMMNIDEYRWKWLNINELCTQARHPKRHPRASLWQLLV